MTQPTQTERNDIPRKPREFWLNEYRNLVIEHAYPSRAEADLGAGRNRLRCIRFREVMEDQA